MNFNPESLRECVGRVRPGVGQLAFTPIATGKFNTSYFVEADGEELVLRIAPPADSVFCFYERDMMRQEPGIHRLLREKTSVPVPEILLYDDSHEAIDRDYLVMERLAGRPISEAPCDYPKVLAQVGECLAQAHGLSADQYGYLGEHQCMTPQATWAGAFVIMWGKLLEDIVNVGHYSRDEADALLRLLDAHLNLFDREIPSSLLHMDVWAQNILVDGARGLTGLVDWDRALWGDVEIEFAVLDYCGISEPAFWEGYGRERDVSAEAQIRRTFYLLYELQKYIVIREGRSHDPAGARRYKQQTMQIVRRSFG